MNDFEKIPMPSPEEKNRAIAAIVDTAMPVRPNLWEQLRQVRQLPVSALFFGVWDCLFLAVILTLSAVVYIAAAVARSDLSAALLFLVSPALYATLHGLTTWKDKMSGTLDWKLTCRISFRTLTALRMLVFGAAATLLCTPMTLLFWTLSSRTLSLFWLLSLSFSSLFLYAALSLFCHTQLRLPLFTAPALWLLLGIIFMASDRTTAFLLRIPPAVFCLTAAFALYYIFTQLQHLLSNTFKGGLSYALR